MIKTNENGLLKAHTCPDRHERLNEKKKEMERHFKVLRMFWGGHGVNGILTQLIFRTSTFTQLWKHPL